MNKSIGSCEGREQGAGSKEQGARSRERGKFAMCDLRFANSNLSVSGLPSPVFRLRSSVSGLPSSVFGLPSSVFRLRSSVFGLPSPVFRLRSSVFGLRSAKPPSAALRQAQGPAMGGEASERVSDTHNKRQVITETVRPA